MKIISKIAVVAISSAIVLSGCSSDNSEPSETEASSQATPSFDAKTSDSKDEPSSETASNYSTPEEAGNAFFAELAKNSVTIADAATKVSGDSGTLAAAIGVENSKAIFESSNPIPIIDRLEPEVQKKASEVFKDLIPDSVPMTYGDLSNSQTVLASSLVMSMGASMASLNAGESPVNPMTSDDVELSDDNIAKVKYTTTNTDSADLTGTYIRVVKNNGSWTVDASYFYEMIIDTL